MALDDPTLADRLLTLRGKDHDVITELRLQVMQLKARLIAWKIATVVGWAVATFLLLASVACAGRRIPVWPADGPHVPVVRIDNTHGLDAVKLYDHRGAFLGRVDAGRERCLELHGGDAQYQLYAEAGPYNRTWSLHFSPYQSPGWVWRLNPTLRTNQFVVESLPCVVAE